MSRFMIGICTIGLFLTLACRARSDDESISAPDLDWLATKTLLTTEVVIPSLSLHGQKSNDSIQRATFRDIQLTAEGGSCRAVFERGPVTFNDFGDGEFVQPPAVESQEVLLRVVPGVDRRGEGRRVYAVKFPEEKFLNRVYIVFSPGAVSPDYLLVVAGQEVPQVMRAPDSGKTIAFSGPDYAFTHIVPLTSQGQPNRLTAVSRRAPSEGQAENVAMPGNPRRSTISIGGRKGAVGWLIDDQNLVSRTAFGDVQSSTLMGFEPMQFNLLEREVQDPTGRGRKVIDLVAIQKPASVASKVASPQFSLVLDAKSSGTDRLLIRTDGQLRNVEAFKDSQREKFLLTRMAVAKSALDLEVVDRTQELVGSGITFEVQDGHIVSATVQEAGVVPSLLKLFPSLPKLNRLQFTNCRSETFSSNVDFLRELQNLESLTFYVTPVSDPVLVHVGAIPKLKHLWIYDELHRGAIPASIPHVTDAGLRHLADLKELTYLGLYGPGISDEGFRALLSLPKLSELNLQRTQVTMRGLVQFKIARPKVKIHVQTVEPRNDSNEPRVMSVEFDGSGQNVALHGDLVGDTEIHELVHLTDLRHVRISFRNEITERGLSELSALPHLETLSLPSLTQLSNREVSAIAKLKTLKELSLWYCEQVDDQAIPDLGQMTSLSKLNIRETSISPEGRKRLQALLPNCTLEE